MNRDNVQQWADELQFGDHKQTRGFFHTPDYLRNHGEVGGSCALGVADLIRTPNPYEMYAGRFIQTVMWLGLSQNELRTIARMNDVEAKTLPEIGAWVRDHWLKEE